MKKKFDALCVEHENAKKIEIKLKNEYSELEGKFIYLQEKCNIKGKHICVCNENYVENLKAKSIHNIHTSSSKSYHRNYIQK